jgi:hypothetical protein
VEEAGVEGEPRVGGCPGAGVGLVKGCGGVLVDGVVPGGDEAEDEGVAVFKGGMGRPGLLPVDEDERSVVGLARVGGVPATDTPVRGQPASSSAAVISAMMLSARTTQSGIAQHPFQPAEGGAALPAAPPQLRS